MIFPALEAKKKIRHVYCQLLDNIHQSKQQLKATKVW